jgi:hypothetical protein
MPAAFGRKLRDRKRRLEFCVKFLDLAGRSCPFFPPFVVDERRYRRARKVSTPPQLNDLEFFRILPVGFS